MRHEELKIMPDKIYLTVCPPLSYEKENKTCTHTNMHAYIYIHTEKILEEINQNSKNNLGYMRYVMFGLFLFVFFFSQVLLV